MSSALAANENVEATPDLAPAEWFTAAELAQLALPGLAGDKRAINRLAGEEGWATRVDLERKPLARPRKGRGGGLEFHYRLLPAEAQLALGKRGLIPGQIAAEPQQDRAWAWFDRQTEKVKREARRRLEIVQEIETLEQAGMTRSAAVAEAAARHGQGESTMWKWLTNIAGLALENRLPALADDRRGGGKPKDIDPELWTLFKSDYLRPSAPPLSSSYRRVSAIAAERGLPMASERTFRRKLKAEVDPQIVILQREGREALRQSLPAQRRTVSHLHALEHVNIDGHTFNVFVRTAEGKVVRPVMVAIQDLYSRKIVAWRMGEVESAALVRLAFADLFQKWGIPKACTLDNGRGFASKWITGGSKSRFRFKIREEEPTGLLTELGIAIHWTLPYRGQSKPIERAFGDLNGTIAQHPLCEGAYTGRNPFEKPENYGTHAVAWDEFEALVAEGIAQHNARKGRRTETAKGRSFDEVFAESYATAPIGKATEEHLRMALLAADQKRIQNDGVIHLYGNRYYSQEIGRHAGERVSVRFDPDNLHGDIHVYAQSGGYLGKAEMIADTGYTTAEAAKSIEKQRAANRKAVRAAKEAEGLIDAQELAQRQARPIEPEVPELSVIRPMPPRKGVAVTAQAQAMPDSRQDEERERSIFTALSVVTGGKK
ncbi:transposase domain-containing protein [Citromicrobium bathyomarinum]